MITSMILVDSSTEKVSEQPVLTLDELDRRLQALCEILLTRASSSEAQDYGSEVMFGVDERYVVRHSVLAHTAYHAFLSLVDTDSRHELEQVATERNLERCNPEWYICKAIPHRGSLTDHNRSVEEEMAYISACLSNGYADTFFPKWTSVYALAKLYLPKVGDSDKLASPDFAPLSHVPHIFPTLSALVELVQREDEAFWDAEGWRSTKYTRLALPTTEFYDDVRSEALSQLQSARMYLNMMFANGVVAFDTYDCWRTNFLRAFKQALCSQECMQLDLSRKISGGIDSPLDDEHLSVILQQVNLYEDEQ